MIMPVGPQNGSAQNGVGLRKMIPTVWESSLSTRAISL